MPDAVEFSHTFHRCSAPRGPSPLSSCLCPLHSVLLKGRDSSPSRHGFTRDAAPTPPQNPYPKEGAHAQHTGLPPCPCWWGTRVREVFSLPPPPLSCFDPACYYQVRASSAPTLPSFASLSDSLTERLVILQDPFQVPAP